MKKWFKKDNLEYEFLPPALEIEETPASPLHRFLIWFIILITILAVLWAIFGRVDEVAVARGQIIPNGRVKVIQPIEEGIIRAIHVDDGQRVKEGEILIELDSTIKQADVESNEKSLLLNKIEKDMLLSELKGEEVGELFFKKYGVNNDTQIKETIQMQQALKKARENENRTREDSLRLVITEKENELRVLESSFPFYEESVELVKEEANAYDKAYQAGAISKMEIINKQKELKAVQQECAEQLTLINKTRDSIAEAKKNLELLSREREKNILNEIKEKDKMITALEGELTKTKKRFELERLTSPVDGTVHGLAPHTIGGVVTPAQPVATIVPEGTPLIVEATALNKDIGFLQIGQDVEVKLDTFPFQKYGTIKGKLIYISPDAIQDEKQGPVYKIKVNLGKTSIKVNGRDISISPGMAVSAEVKTGRRRIIEFFLSPIIKYAKEGLTIR